LTKLVLNPLALAVDIDPNNPLYRLELNRLRLPDRSAFERRRRRYIAVTLAAAFALLSIIYYWFSRNAFPQEGLAANVFITNVFITLAANLMLDISSFVVTVNSLNQFSEHNDLIRLTGLDEMSIVNAKYNVALLRLWRVTSLVASLRVAFVLVFTIMVVREDGFSVFLSPHYYRSLVVMIPFVLEPHWRARTITAARFRLVRMLDT
jgi:hypothetical protein